MHLFTFFVPFLAAIALAVPIEDQQLPFIAETNDERNLVPMSVLSLFLSFVSFSTSQLDFADT